MRTPTTPQEGEGKMIQQVEDGSRKRKEQIVGTGRKSGSNSTYIAIPVWLRWHSRGKNTSAVLPSVADERDVKKCPLQLKTGLSSTFASSETRIRNTASRSKATTTSSSCHGKGERGPKFSEDDGADHCGQTALQISFTRALLCLIGVNPLAILCFVIQFVTGNPLPTDVGHEHLYVCLQHRHGKHLRGGGNI